ncbi:nitrate reductase associated protein [Pedobacter agri]|uniref:nitrate reductase associated protein n=1 Tax=Pedobacter agri TaxID=454586 RepID=UPI00292E89D1|nr:nitrate reductase associated protein [Pedobacter agri]
MMTKVKTAPSEFKNLKGIEYFDFEEDFMEDNIRCIPMVVRFKLDLAGIKLKLGEWVKFHATERIELALLPTSSLNEIKYYRDNLIWLIAKHTGNAATLLAVDPHPKWENLHAVPDILKEKAEELDLRISVSRWQNLTNIQRFALLKLCRPGHENKNFPKAMAEFGLIIK